MNFFCLPQFVPIVSAGNDSGVLAGGFAIKTKKVLSVVRENRAALRGGEKQNLVIGNAPPRIAGRVCREDIVPKFTQPLHYAEWVVFI